MHICLNFIFKKELTINGSNIFWNCSFTEGKIVLTKWPEMASPAFLVLKIFRGRTPGTPFQIRKYVIYFSIQHCSTQAFCWKRGFQLGIKKQHSISIFDLWLMVYINLLPKDLLHPFHTTIYITWINKDQDPITIILENWMLICSLILLEFQWNNLYFA